MAVAGDVRFLPTSVLDLVLRFCKVARIVRPKFLFRKFVRQQGFALVATLSMMLLLLVLGVGLLSLSVISLRGSTHGEARQIAQGNARLALMLALAQLQKDAGDDFAVTATADIAGKMDPIKGLVPPRAGSRYWTGVWQNSVAPAQAATQIYSRTPVPAGRGWLVSGGESQPILPDSPRAAIGANGEVSSPDDAVLLVGPGSVGPATPETVEDYVAVPLVSIPGRGRIPGGRYGWWVGDEGVKTRYNLPSDDEDAAPLGNPVTYASLGSRGGGWETVNGFTDYPPRGSVSEANLTRVVSVPAAAILDPTLSAQDSALKHSFHSITTDSRGLITDSLLGGFRLDLTRYLENGFPAAADEPTIPNAPSLTTNIIPRTAARTIRGPRWERLRSFAKLAESVTDGTMVVKAAASENDVVIAPIITDFRILMGGKLMSDSTTSYRIFPCGKIAVSLANPYPFALRWDRDLELEVLNVSPTGNNPSRIFDSAGQPPLIPAHPGEPAVFNNTVFTVPPGTLEPGEALAYTITGPVERPYNTARISVRLGPFSGSSATSFENSVIMQHGGVNNGPVQLDIRESWTTSLISIEMRLGGGSRNSLLRKIEKLELDNAYYASVKRPVDANIARQITRPFPLHLYSFQLSQPGADYANILSTANPLGSLNSTLRTFMDFNLQGTRITRPIAAYNAPPYFMESSDSLAGLPFTAPGGQTGPGFTRNLAVSPLSWGRSPSTGPKKTILFSPQDQIISLAQFQHADLTADDFGPSVSHQPGNAVGNSYATPFVKRSMTSQTRRDYVVLGSQNPSGTSSTSTTYYDLSYLLNAALWDTYFLSTIPGSGLKKPTNPRLVEIKPGTAGSELDSATLAASHLWIEGAFNVNSTNKDAWKALLASNRSLKHPSETTEQESVMFPRSLSQPGEAVTPKPTGTRDDSFSGFRRLNDQQLDALAEEITRQVRLRGPFVSLSHFINRSVVELRNDTDGLGRSGALQSAIDLSGLNMSPSRTDSGFSGLVPRADQVTLLADGNSPRACMYGERGSVFPNEEQEPVWGPRSKDLNPGSIASILADRPMLTDARFRSEQGFRSTGIPGWLTQADVLQVIGPILSVRSDTFRIRSYGEALDSQGRPVARAWCEAIVQRTPDYLDPTNPRTARPLAAPAVLTPVNSRFGRRFEIVSFRWLSPHEV
jgi:Arc/MetJ-type ribon-helix-helix transcriptional regulator